MGTEFATRRIGIGVQPRHTAGMTTSRRYAASSFRSWEAPSSSGRPRLVALWTIARKLPRVVNDGDEAFLLESPRERHLVIVDRLTVGGAPRDDERAVAARQYREHRTDPAVGDDDASVLDQPRQLIERKELHAARSRRPELRRTMLNDDLLARCQVAEIPQKPIERNSIRSCRDENHAAKPQTLPAYRDPWIFGASSGHWTKTAEATGLIIRQLRDGESILVKLSM